MSDRIKQIVKPTAIVLAIGFTYLLIHEWTGFSIPCPFWTIFHLYCPGCGVSRMCIHLFHGEIYEAFSSNCVIFCLLPITLADAMFHAYRYIRYGYGRFNRVERVAVWVIIGILVMFGIVRNAYPIDVLVP